MHESLWVEGRCLLGREENSPSAMTMVHKLSTGHSALGTDEAVFKKIVPLNTHTHTHTEAVFKKIVPLNTPPPTHTHIHTHRGSA